MNKNTPQKLSIRLTQYGVLSLAIACVTDASGQITYTPVNLTFGIGDDYSLDLNNDGTPDFNIFHEGVSYSNLRLAPLLASNDVLGIPSAISPSSFAFAYALGDDVTISNTPAMGSWLNHGFNPLFSWMDLNYGSQASFCSAGYWCDVADKFLGLRFKIGAETHYGWARMSVDPIGDVWTIKDYAYNTTHDEAIDTGQTTLGLNDNILTKVKIVALNKSIALFNLPQQTNYRLFTITGQSVLDGKITNSTHVIEANTLASGIYIIELKDNTSNAIIRKKIVL